MCQKCVDAVAKYFPKLRKKDYGSLLMGATAFPMGDAKYIKKQLRELSKNTNGTLEGVLIYAHRQLVANMEKVRIKEASHE